MNNTNLKQFATTKIINCVVFGLFCNFFDSWDNLKVYSFVLDLPVDLT